MKSVLKTHKAILLYGMILLAVCFFLWLPFLRVTSLPSYEQATQALSDVIEQDALVEQDARFIRRNYQLSSEQYEKAVVYRKHAAMDVEEIAVFQLGENRADALVKGCEYRIAQQIESFAGYGEEQVAQLQKAILLQNDAMVILIIHEEPDQIKQLLWQQPKEEDAS